MFLFGRGLTDLPSPLPTGNHRAWIPAGNAGTEVTIRAMQAQVETGKRDPRIRELAGKLIQGCPGKDYFCYAKAIADYCREEIKYAFDPVGVEYIEHPAWVLQNKIADCDSICVLLASLYENIGLASRFVTIKADPRQPNEYSHVYLQVAVPKHGWVSADCTMPTKPFGWSPPERFAKKYWPASKDSQEAYPEFDTMTGMGEGPIPGIEDFPPVLQGRGADVDFFYTPQNLNLTPPQSSLLGLDDVGDLGATSRDNQNILDVLDGTTASVLEQASREQQERNGQIYGDMALALQKMPDGPMKDEAAKLYYQADTANRIAQQQLSNGIDNYNYVARLIMENSPFAPRQVNALHGLGEPITAGTVITIAAIAGVIVALNQLVNLIGAWKGNANASKGYIDQFADAVRAGGGVIESTTSFVNTVALWAAIGAAGWLGYKFLAKRGHV